MQSFGPRTSSAGTTYTAAQVQAALLAPVARETFAFDRLNGSLVWQAELTGKVDLQQPPHITHDAMVAQGRQLQLRIRKDATLAVLKDCVRVRYRLSMADGGWVDVPLGVFIVTTYEDDIAPEASWVNVEARDLLQLLIDSPFSQSYAVPAGSDYVDAIAGIVATYGGITPIPVNIPSPGTALPQPLGWEVGTSRLQAINELLEAVAYVPAWMDENGVLRSGAIPDYSAVQPSFSFDVTAGSAYLSWPGQPRYDASLAFNIALVRVEDPRTGKPLWAQYTNTSPSSPVSTVNWQPKTKVITDSKIPDWPSAMARGRAAVQEAARVYASGPWHTPAWPLSQNLDVYRVVVNTADEGTFNQKVLEIGWEMECKPGGLTTHEWQLIPAGV